MRWITLLLALAPVLAAGQTSVPIHVTIVMHSEQSARYDLNPVLFENNRTNLYRFASMLSGHGVMFNFQSDWTFLTAVTNYDRLGHPETGGTNIVAWMKHTLGFEIDPHNHVAESIYNYADVAALITACGVTPSGVAGGYIAMPVEDNEWPLFQQPFTGAVYNTSVWTPKVLWGGGSGLHINETNLWFSGVYCPRDATNYWTHHTGNLPLVGGYGGKSILWTNLDELIALRDAGLLCTGRIYTCNLMAGLNNITPAYTADFSNRLQAYTNKANLRWVGIAEVTNIWAAEYATQASYLPYVVTNDLDEDGLIDGWEVTNFCGIVESDGTGDHDSDHQTDASEYIAGTSPTHNTDVFAIVTLRDTIIEWTAVPGRTYRLEAGDGTTWTHLLTRPATTNLESWTNTTPATSQWYRVLVSGP